MSDWGLKISLPGFDVKTATPEQCALHSGFACPKIEVAHSGYTLQKTQVITIGSNPANHTTTNLLAVNHPYSYPPLATATWLYDFLSGRGAEYGQLPLALNVGDTLVSYTTSSQFRIDLVRNQPGSVPNLTGTAFTVRYTICADTGA